MIGKYGAWDIKEGMATHPGGLQIPIRHSGDSVVGEGWWPKKPKGASQTVLTGICLWDARWLVVFPQKSGPNILRSPAIPQERDHIFQRLSQKNWVSNICIPTKLGAYHNLLIRWQAEQIRKVNPKRVLYHVPTKEYHCYVGDLEAYLGSLPLLHEKLDEFARQVILAVQREFSLGGIEFISPMDKGARTPVDSFTLPYLRPDLFGFDPKTAVGIEDLVEVRLSSSAWKQTQKGPVPVLAAILGLPHPYLNKDSGEGVESIQL